MSRVDRSYYRRRVQAEWRRSREARSADAAMIHQQLAIEYEDRLRSGYAGVLLAMHEDAVTV